MTKIGIVNDSVLAVEALRRAVGLRSDFEVIWVAHDGVQAVDLCALQPPDVLLMDLIMPVMDGVAATREIMRRSPCPILIVTGDVGHHASLVFDAMGAGALDAVDTPVLAGSDPLKYAQALLAKIDAVAGQLRYHSPVALPASPRALTGTTALAAIGASAGGPAALATLLGELPANFGAGIVIVQHVDEAFAQGMATWLDSRTALPVRLAREDDFPVAGEVLLAGGNRHLRIDGNARCGYSMVPEDAVYRPSVDVFFESVAAGWTGRAVGVLLTGMGRDGAAGLQTMRARGFATVAQDRATSAVYGMPKAAAECGAASEILPLGSIARYLVKTFGSE